MKTINLINRYNDSIIITKDDDKDYYLFDPKNCSYISEHYEADKKTIKGIDPEGLYIVGVGDNVPQTTDKITKIVPFGKKYRLYIND